MAFPSKREKEDNQVSAMFENADAQEVNSTPNVDKNVPKEKNDNNQKSISLITKPEIENRKKYSFTIKPSAREKLNQLAKEHNYPSASRFIEELIENI
jgi:hypothetical protein